MIAVISKSRSFADKWLRDHFKIIRAHMGLCWYQDDKGNSYQVVTDSKTARALEFDGMLVLPDYDDVVGTVNSGLRSSK